MPIKRRKLTMDGNTAAAHVAYAMSEVCPIYPITPSTPMAGAVESFGASGKNLLGEPAVNIYGDPVPVVTLQSEAGAAGTQHGLLSAGTLATGFTASQGLLLMIPNLYKMAGEALPAVIHVAARTVATHALSIFGDHSDIYACRQTGVGLLASSSPQEVMDLAPVAHMAALEGSTPFLHFFDGFRTSGELSSVQTWSYKDLASLIDSETVSNFRHSALSPTHPSSRGSAENGDIYFQHREAANSRYDALPGVVEHCLSKVNEKLGTDYGLFNYYGAPDAERVIIAMGSFCDTVAAAVDVLCSAGEKVGLVKVRLYRPFSNAHLLQITPKTVRKIAVLDRTKEPGAPGEPLYMDVVSAFAGKEDAPKIVGGRYGLSSKDTPPAAAFAIFSHLLQEDPRHGFTVGIDDDVTGLSLPMIAVCDTLPAGTISCKLWGIGGDGTVGAAKSTAKIVGEEEGRFVQAYFQYDSKKTGGITTAHLRIGKQPIRAPYYVNRADIVACHNMAFLSPAYPMLEELTPGGILLLDCPYDADALEDHLPSSVKAHIAQNGIDFYVIDATGIAEEIGNRKVKNMVLQAAFFAISGLVPFAEAAEKMAAAVEKNYRKFGETVVAQNKAAITRGKTGLFRITPKTGWENEEKTKMTPRKYGPPPTPFAEGVVASVSHMRGDRLPVSAFLPIADGAFPQGTTAFEKRGIAPAVSCWIPENCIQCNTCAYVCPHATIRAFALDDVELQKVPKNMKIAQRRVGKTDFSFAIAISPLDCMGCTLCVGACPVNRREQQRAEKAGESPDKDKFALVMAKRETQLPEQAIFDHAVSKISEKSVFSTATVRESQFKQPFLQFSGACAGCAETSYARLVTQLFGQRMYIANATGCSSIWGCSAPFTAYAAHQKTGHGPVFANSLFEDNAEFGYGFYLSEVAKRGHFRRLITDFLKTDPPADLMAACSDYLETFDNGEKNQDAAQRLTALLTDSPHPMAATILEGRDCLAKKSIWIFGGDGWAYDIGFGGLDHVLSTGADVNVLVFDTEVYSNTGGQISKASVSGQVAEFAISGKTGVKKRLADMMLTYGHVYVAQVSMGADMPQLLKALREAEAYPGPSLVIAYSPCEMHGIRGGGMKNSLVEMKKAVDCGYFHLFRYDPAKKEDPFTIDSPAPVIDLAVFLEGESRFARLRESDPERAKTLWQQAKVQADSRYAALLAAARHFNSRQILPDPANLDKSPIM